MKERNICFLNCGSVHYRKAIWMLMDSKLQCDFYFGDRRRDDVKPLETNLLHNFKGFFHNVYLGPFYWQRGALQLLRGQYTDIIIQGETYNLTMWIMLLLNKFYKRNIYLWSHGAYGSEKGLKRWIRTIDKRMATGVFLYGNHARQLLHKWGVPFEKMHLIYNSLDYDVQLKIRKNIETTNIYFNHYGNHNINLVFIGRLTSIKRLDQLLYAVHKLKKQGKNYNVTIVGDGEIKMNLLKLSKELNLECNTWIYGACYDEFKIAELLYNADLCVSPGNVGLTAMHAMGYGCPVLSNDNYNTQMPEYEAINDGNTGTFFHENDIDSLANSIERWFNNSHDREIVRKACFSVIDSKYNPHVQVETLKKVILKNKI